MYTMSQEFVRNDVDQTTNYFYTIADDDQVVYKLLVSKSDKIVYAQHKSSQVFDRFEEILNHVISDFLSDDGLSVSE